MGIPAEYQPEEDLTEEGSNPNKYGKRILPLLCPPCCLCDSCNINSTVQGQSRRVDSRKPDLRMHQPLSWDSQCTQGRLRQPMWVRWAWISFVDCDADCSDIQPTTSASRCQSS